jgi:hypothetical protein
MPRRKDTSQQPEEALSATSSSLPPSSQRLDAPCFYAATAQVLISGNDATLLFTRPHPAVFPDGSLAPAPMPEPVALVHMSIASLKDLVMILGDVIYRVEAQSGEIRSQLTRRNPGDGASRPSKH